MQELENLIKYYQSRIDRIKKDTANLLVYADKRANENKPWTTQEMITWNDIINKNYNLMEIYLSTIKYLKEVKDEHSTIKS